MAKVSNIEIIRENGTDGYYARWVFNEEKTSVASPSTVIKKGSVVYITGSKYYTGVNVPDAVKYVNKSAGTLRAFNVTSISGDRAVLGGSTDGAYKDICSPVSTSNLELVSGGSGSTSGTTQYNKYLDHYEVTWYYATGQENKDKTTTWFNAGKHETTEKKSNTYDPPDNATTIRVKVKPVAKTYKEKSGDTEVDKPYYTGTHVYQWFDLGFSIPQDLSAPAVEQDETGLKLTVSSEINPDQPNNVTIEKIEFNVVDVNTGKVAFKQTVDVRLCEAKYTFTIKVGGKYKARCRSVNNHRGSTVYGKWSAYTDEITTPPAAVTGFRVMPYMDPETGKENMIEVSWVPVANAKSYEYQYSPEAKYFDRSSDIPSKTVEGRPPMNDGRITDLLEPDSGKTYYFRIRAVNDKGKSGWSEIISATVGSKPEPPTTWSLSTTAMLGDKVPLYWVHNAEDGSRMRKAEIRLKVDGETKPLIPVNAVTNYDENPIHSWMLDTSVYGGDGVKIVWEVRTYGVVSTPSNYSIPREIEVFNIPTVFVNVHKETIGIPGLSDDGTEITISKEAVTTYPITIDIASESDRQIPITYHVAITNKEAYESVDLRGSTVYIPANTSVYSKVITTSERDLTLSLSAGDVHLESGITYAVTVTVALNSGLVGVGTDEFFTSFGQYEYEPEAAIGIDEATITTHITPYCMGDDGYLADNVLLSIYRREYNGLFTTIATDVPNNGIETIIDPHPALDYARYRIVAMNTTTGSISYEDLPAQPVNIHDIVIQWDETWSNFDYTEDAYTETPPWTGSMIRFAYNIDVTESYSPDVSLVQYAGREHPVSYFGTQRGETATWNAVIPATDKEMIYALRRLSAYRGNVYVREPSGTGYWAHVTVSFPIKHKDVSIAVSFNITRVEGGM